MANPEKVVTREAVFEIAGRIKAGGAEPSNRRVLAELGGGSMTTIAGFLREWKAQQEIEAPAQADISNVPPVVAEAVNQSVAAIWAVCKAEMRRELEALTEQANQRIKSAEEERDRVLMELAEAETDLTCEKEAVSLCKGELQAANSANQVLSVENTTLKNESETARAVSSEIERRAVDLQGVLDIERKRNETVQQELKASNTLLNTANNKLSLLALELETMKEKHESIGQTIKELSAEREVMIVDLENLKDSKLALNEKFSLSEYQNAELKGRLGAIQDEVKQLRSRTGLAPAPAKRQPKTVKTPVKTIPDEK